MALVFKDDSGLLDQYLIILGHKENILFGQEQKCKCLKLNLVTLAIYSWRIQI